ncbi:MAG: UDP-N-acetylmuramoyl-L-alanyl-D-glutamate--2,6-diaminopimelate ligase [Eubacteriales bacterium]|nr:UDP-N-acetylmuramoyl-L-alanyl-D-glutamate--2,6-diaminopimelate ligase [Eubacteriales bacterium]
MRLTELLHHVKTIQVLGNIENVDIQNLNIDSRKQTSNGLFFCISGANFDAHTFVAQAIQNGNIALVVERALELDVPQIVVQNTRIAMPQMASLFFGEPQKNMKFIGITGTKGKTTTSFMVKSIFEAAGYTVGLIGTTGNMIGNRRFDSNLTTPDAIDLYQMLALMKQENVQVVVMEVSAHAIDMHRLEGLCFDVGCYTNFSQDHLDYFGDMDAYYKAKEKFFTGGLVKNAAINADEITSATLLKNISIPHLCFGIGANADVYARNIEVEENGASFEIYLNDVDNLSIHMKMTGNFNVYNALCAASAAMILNVDLAFIQQGLENVKSVPGRIELLDTNTPFKVILDYSHSPDSLKNILSAVREFTKKRLILVFGCGGDRDHIKRPIMGAIAGKMADFSVITSDNPRNENPMQIIDAIVDGYKKNSDQYVVIEDRRQAIAYALSVAGEGDVIILAGKGHETYQDRNGVKYPFNEKIIVKELLEELKEA